MDMIIHFIQYEWQNEIVTTACGRDKDFYNRKGLKEQGLTRSEGRTTCKQCKSHFWELKQRR